VRELFEALQTECDKALKDLKARSLTKADIVAWTKAYHLECRFHTPEMSGAFTGAWGLRTWWERNPDAAAKLIIGGPETMLFAAAAKGSPEDLWLKSHQRGCLPFPRGESLEQYLARARKMYRELNALIPKSQRFKARRHDRAAENMKWFVRVQVKGKRPSSVAGKHATRSAVEKAVHRIAKDLGVCRRPFPRGPRTDE
jgi:hypothetical protein